MRSNDDFVGTFLFAATFICGVVASPFLVNAVTASNRESAASESPFSQTGTVPVPIQEVIIHKNMASVKKWKAEVERVASGKNSLSGLTLAEAKFNYTRAVDSYNEYARYGVTEAVFNATVPASYRGRCACPAGIRRDES